jgi:hypothetical protein
MTNWPNHIILQVSIALEFELTGATPDELEGVAEVIKLEADFTPFKDLDDFVPIKTLSPAGNPSAEAEPQTPDFDGFDCSSGKILSGYSCRECQCKMKGTVCSNSLQLIVHPGHTHHREAPLVPCVLSANTRTLLPPPSASRVPRAQAPIWKERAVASSAKVS